MNHPNLHGGYFYLGSAYSHPDTSVMEKRFLQAEEATALLLKKGVWTYSPIVHIHRIAVLYELPRTFEFWNEYNRTMIDASVGLIILRNDGWQESRGLKDEIEYCKQIRKRVFDIECF